ncbi:calcium-dependent protein kinase 4-like isoform X1 [Zingiber officinale]|uniref:calcium-dependent protein kinase 4-like isoform X1 n=1 Tax=Zingiber officinale TaxID=94328 RepID=UPI001C4B2509|nr:calcium-dependent protein kinase 4-like isoform X1 [Zingiber officinale]
MKLKKLWYMEAKQSLIRNWQISAITVYCVFALEDMAYSEAIASILDEEELADLKDQFQVIDVDKSGLISFEEMKQALAKDVPWRLRGPRVPEILQVIDSNTDGLVDFREFVAATLHVHQMEQDSHKWHVMWHCIRTSGV